MVWFIFRFGMFLVGVGYRFYLLLLPDAKFEARPGGIEVRVDPKIFKSFFKSNICLKIKPRLSFQLVPKTKWLRWFKSAGLGRDVQIGDPKFDEIFYIITENKGLVEKLRHDAELRACVLKLYGLGYTEFVSEGFGYLLIETQRSDVLETADLIKTLSKIKHAFEEVPSRSLFSEPFVLWSLIIEIFVFGLGAYGSSIFFSVNWGDFNPVLDENDYFVKALITTLMLVFAWFFAIFPVLLGSSRGLLLLREYTFIYCFFAVWSGGVLFRDLNWMLDMGSATVSTAVIENKDRRYYRVEHKSGPSRNTRLSILSVRFSENLADIPNVIEVGRSFYDDCRVGDGLRIVVQPGFFDSPYIASIERVPNPFKK